MNFAKTSVLFLVLLFALFSCGGDDVTPERAGLGAGPTPSVTGGNGPYLPYFKFSDPSIGEGELHVVGSVARSYNVMQSAASIKRNSLVMSYSGIPSLATLRTTRLAPSEIFYVDSGYFYRADVSLNGNLRQQQIASISDIGVASPGETVCEQRNDAFLNLPSFVATFFFELPSASGCADRQNNTIVRLTENDLIDTAPADITTALTLNGNSAPTALKNIQTIRVFSGNNLLAGYLVADGIKLFRFDANFTNPVEISITPSPVTSVTLGGGGTGLKGGFYNGVFINFVTVDGVVHRYDDGLMAVDTLALYPLAATTATIDAQVCKKEECLFVEKDGANLSLYVIKADGTEQAKLLMPAMQGPDNVFDSVTTMVRNSSDITFKVVNSPADATAVFGLYQIDISKLSSPFELNQVDVAAIPTTSLEALPVTETSLVDPADLASTQVTVNIKANNLDLFLTSGVVYFNKDYDRIHDLGMSSQAYAMVADPNHPAGLATSDPLNMLTQYPMAAWVGLIDTEVSRQQIIEKIILANTKQREDENGDPIPSELETKLTVYNMINNAISAELGTLAKGIVDTTDLLFEKNVDVVHMSFQFVGNMGLGDAYITSADNAATLQSDVYYIDTLRAGSLELITPNSINENENESAFATCTYTGSLFCR